MTSLHAQDCEGLKNNEVVRLDAKDGPLYGSPVQDQDGLGTCYGNSTSIALKTALPGNPDLSYLQLSLRYTNEYKAPANALASKDSAFEYDDAGKKTGLLLEGGSVCKTIIAAKSGSGICKREDVELENLIFNKSTGTFSDQKLVQFQIMEAVGKLYDSVKLKFGPMSGNDPIANLVNFTDFQKYLKSLIDRNSNKYIEKVCMTPDFANVDTVLKNTMARIYQHLRNKNITSLNVFKSSPEDQELFLFGLSQGNAFSPQNNKPISDLRFSYDVSFKKHFEKEYMKALKSGVNSGAEAYFSVLKSSPELSKKEKILKEYFLNIPASDKKMLEEDFSYVAKGNIKECKDKNSLLYFTKEDAMVADMERLACFSEYKQIGSDLRSLFTVLDQYNFSNINKMNQFISMLPELNYEEAMKKFISPDCSPDKRIKIPSNLNCLDRFLDFTNTLENYAVNNLKYKTVDINARVEAEFKSEKMKIEAEFATMISALDINILSDFPGLKPDSKEFNAIKKKKITALNTLKNKKIENIKKGLRTKILKVIAGAKTEELYKNFLSTSKEDFRNDTLSLLKKSKQAIPITMCTRLYDDPKASSQRDGKCEQDTSRLDNYSSVGGHHSVNVIGAKCVKGKIKYLVQNSWGDWSAIKNVKKPNGESYFESEAGKAWFDEEELLNNTTEYQRIVKEK